MNKTDIIDISEPLRTLLDEKRQTAKVKEEPVVILRAKLDASYRPLIADDPKIVLRAAGIDASPDAHVQLQPAAPQAAATPTAAGDGGTCVYYYVIVIRQIPYRDRYVLVEVIGPC